MRREAYSFHNLLRGRGFAVSVAFGHQLAYPIVATAARSGKARTTPPSSRSAALSALSRSRGWVYHKAMATIDPALLAEFEAAARRPLAQRWRYSFIRTYKPVLDDANYRSFDTMEEYRRWCEEHLPDWLGYGRVRIPPG